MKNTIDIPGKTFKDFFKTISYVISECKLHINNGVLYVKAVDEANVMLIDISADLSKGLDAQARLSQEKEQDVVFGVDVSQIHRLSKMIADTDLVTMSWKPVNDFYVISIETNNYSVKVLSVDMGSIRKEPNPPSVKITASFSVNLSVLGEFVDVIHEKARFVAKDGKVKIVAVFDKYSRVIKTLGPAKGEGNSLFSTDYIHDITRAFPKHTAKMEIGTDVPFIICLTSNQITVKWMLAPRVMADGEEEREE